MFDGGVEADEKAILAGTAKASVTAVQLGKPLPSPIRRRGNLTAYYPRIG